MWNRTGRRQRSTLAQHSGVHRSVKFGLLFWVVWDAVTNDPLTIYCLTSIDHAISLHVSEVPFSSMVSAHTIVCMYCVHTMYVCRARVPTVPFVFKHACSKINLCICTSVYKFNIDELLLKLLAKRGSLTCFMYLPVQARVRDAAVCARAVHTEQNTTRMYSKELSFAPKCFLIAYIFKQTRLKIACKWYNLVTTCSGPIWQVTNPSVLHAIGQSLLSSPGTPLENNRTT